MKKLNTIQLEQTIGGICVIHNPSGHCMPCPAFLAMFNGLAGGLHGQPICIA